MKRNAGPVQPADILFAFISRSVPLVDASGLGNAEQETSPTTACNIFTESRAFGKMLKRSVKSFVVRTFCKLYLSRSLSENSVVGPRASLFFPLAKTAKQAMLVLSSMQPDAAKRKKGRLKPDRVLRQTHSEGLLLEQFTDAPQSFYSGP